MNVLELKKVTKIYPGGTVANYQVDFAVKEGEIHALVGENGAGKSTLMKIVFGMIRPTEGDMFVNEQKVDFHSSQDAIKHGIGMVHQHFMLVPNLTVTENIILGSEIQKFGFLDKKKQIKEVENLAQKYNLPVNAKSKVMDISVSKKQKVEILKTLYRGAKILILDEPTAVLTPQEIVELFEQLKILKKEGHTIIFISHKLNEIIELCDRLTIMRDGKTLGSYDVDKVTENEISRLMVGRDVHLDIEKKPANPGEVLLSVRDLQYVNLFDKKAVQGVSFDVRRGEVLGIAGIEDNGQSELIELITGLQKGYQGKIFLKSEDISSLNIKQIREKGLAHIPEDRMKTGTGANLSIKENILADRFDSKDLNQGVFLNDKKITELSKEIIKEFQIKATNEQAKIKGLSGGNIQKVVVGREFTTDADVLIVNQPTRGIDVGTIEFIRKKIIDMRDAGKAILLVSADLNEVLSLSDLLIVMSGGKIVGFFDSVENVTEEELGLYMLGAKKQSPEEIRGAIHEK